ncbi:MAG: response regulator [Nitrospirota bacterium]|nr:response regulator [Nitrospirota bacterium]
MNDSGDVPDVRKKRFVLIVDDNAKDAYYTGMLLQNFGYNATTVRSAEEALEYISIAVPALVVTELKLPGMNGFDFLAKLRKHRGIPVIIQTQLADLESEDLCRRENCAVYLRKPVHAEELYRAVQTVLEETPRRNIRVATFLRTSIDGAGTGTEFITMLSDTGCFVKTLGPRPVGTKHSVSFMVGKRIVRTEAQVLYTYSFGEGPNKEPGMGMRFLGLTPDDKAQIEQFIRNSVVPQVRPG